MTIFSYVMFGLICVLGITLFVLLVISKIKKKKNKERLNNDRSNK